MLHMGSRHASPAIGTKKQQCRFWLDHFGLIAGLLESKIVGESRHEAMPGRCSWMIRTLAAAVIVVLGPHEPALAALLTPAGSIPLGFPKGAISDLGFDYANRRLFALEPDAAKLVVVDLLGGAVSQTLRGLWAPQGLAHEPPNGQLYVALGGGQLAVFQGVPLQRTATIPIGPNLGPPSYDAGTTQVYFAHIWARSAS